MLPSDDPQPSSPPLYQSDLAHTPLPEILVTVHRYRVPGIIESVLREAPASTRVVVVGVCMQRDTVTPMFAVVKELDLRFSMAYDPMEFEATLRSIAEGPVEIDIVRTIPTATGFVTEHTETQHTPDGVNRPRATNIVVFTQPYRSSPHSIRGVVTKYWSSNVVSTDRSTIAVEDRSFNSNSPTYWT